MSQPLRFVVEHLHVAVPPADLLTIRGNLERAGLTLQDAPSTPTRTGVVLHAERVVELEVSLERDSVKLAEIRLAKAVLSSTSLSIEEAVAEQLELARPESAGVYAAAMLDPGGSQTPRRRRKRERVWLKVFRVTVEDVIPTGYELGVYNEPDADRQLDLLASVAPLRRPEITIKPKPGWEGYGDLTVFGRPVPQR